MIRYKKVIFVDTSDNCRAPMAELILKRKFLTNPLAEAVLAANGYPDPSHTARQLEQEDIGGDVLLLTMEDRQKSQIWETFENAPHVFTLREYAGESGDVPALYGQPLAVYSQCYTELELLLRKVVVRLNEEEEL